MLDALKKKPAKYTLKEKSQRNLPFAYLSIRIQLV